MGRIMKMNRAARALTFEEAARQYFDQHERKWRNAKHRAQFLSTLRTYTFPVIGRLPVSAIDVGLVPKVIEPIWPTKTETANRVRGRIEAVNNRDETLAILSQLTDRFESSRAKPWRLQLEGARLDALVGAIVGFHMTIERVDAKFKLSQNRSGRDRNRVIEALRGEGFSDAHATAEWMTGNAQDR